MIRILPLSRCTVVIVLSLLASITLIQASEPTPHLITVLGKATTVADVPLASGDIAVRIYTAAADGSLVFNSGDDFNSTINEGRFDITLGAVTPLQLDNTLQYYMEIDVDGDEVVGDANGGRIAFYPGGGSHSRSDLESRLDYLESVFGIATSRLSQRSVPTAATSGRSADYEISFGVLGMAAPSGSIPGLSLSGLLLFQPVGVFSSADHKLLLGPYYAGVVTSCCVGRVGNANGQGDYPDEVTLGDIMLMVDVKFISGDCSKLSCLTEADVNQDGGANPNCDDHITLGDIMTLVDFLFITGPENATLPSCL
jgi:hypothetical protein